MLVIIVQERDAAVLHPYANLLHQQAGISLCPAARTVQLHNHSWLLLVG